MGYPTATQDSLPDGWPAFPGGCWLPAGSQRKVSGHPLLLSQASPGALTMPARTQAKADDAVTRIRAVVPQAKLKTAVMDLSSLKSVRAFAAQQLADP